jgi:ribosomal protein S6
MARKKAVITTSSETLEPRVYELGFLLSPAVREEDLDARVDEIKESITGAAGEIITLGRPEFIDLMYEMTKVIDNKNVQFRQGYFGWIKFTLVPDQLAAVTALLEKNPLIIRMLMVKTVAENTVISKKPLSKILKSSAREEIVEGEIVPAVELDETEEDIDPGMAAIELQTPVNDDAIEAIDETPVDTSDETEKESE